MFVSPSPELSAALALHAAELGPFGSVQYLDEADSTNDLALKLAATGAAEGTSVLADRQRAGRGRRGHVWFSPAGAGVYLSIVLRPDSRALPLVTMACGVAVATALTQLTSLPIELKWPNDVVIARPWRKLGGLLCESSTTGSQVAAVVAGIGVNILSSAFPPEIASRATSLELELGRPIARERVVVEILRQVRQVSERLRRGDLVGICDDWRRFGQAGLDGPRVRWDDGRGMRDGIARDIDDSGALLVETNGQVERIIAGDVTWDGFSS